MCLVAVMNSFSIPSVPRDLFAFKDLIAALISLSLIGLSKDACDSWNVSLFSRCAKFSNTSCAFKFSSDWAVAHEFSVRKY